MWLSSVLNKTSGRFPDIHNSCHGNSQNRALLMQMKQHELAQHVSVGQRVLMAQSPLFALTKLARKRINDWSSPADTYSYFAVSRLSSMKQTPWILVLQVDKFVVILSKQLYWSELQEKLVKDTKEKVGMVWQQGKSKELLTEKKMAICRVVIKLHETISRMTFARSNRENSNLSGAWILYQKCANWIVQVFKIVSPSFIFFWRR